MKKFAALLAVLILCLSFSFTAFAGDWAFKESQDKVVILGDGDAAVYKGDVYTRFDMGVGDDLYTRYDYYNTEPVDYVFENRKLEDERRYFEVFVARDYVLQTQYFDNSIMEDHHEEYFIKNSYIEWVESFLDGEKVHYEIEHTFGLDGYRLSPEKTADWKNEETKITLDGGDEFFYYDIDWTQLNETDEGGFFYRPIGMVIRKHDIVTDKYSYYALFYSDYERNCFYADGSFAIGVPGVETYLYPIFVGDEVTVNNVTQFWDSLPEDELDWIMGETSDLYIAVTCGILFVLLPLAGMVFAVIQLFVKKVKYSKVGYIVLLAAGVVSIACYLIVLNLLA